MNHKSAATAAFPTTVETIFLSSEHSNDTKGRVLENYMIRMLDQPSVKTVGFRLPTCEATGMASGERKNIVLEFDIGPYYVHRFRGNKVPSDVDWMMPTLFIPMIPNYPEFDLLMWNGRSLLAVQITVSMSTHKDISKKMYKMWLEALPARRKEIQFLWIAPDGSQPTPDQQKQTPCRKFLCTLSVVSKSMPMFDLVRHLRLK